MFSTVDHTMKCSLFSAVVKVDWSKREREVEKTSYSATQKTQAVTTLCHFQCCVAEVRAVATAVLLLKLVVYRVLRAKVVGATSSEGSLVKFEGNNEF